MAPFVSIFHGGWDFQFLGAAAVATAAAEALCGFLFLRLLFRNQLATWNAEYEIVNSLVAGITITKANYVGRKRTL
jgi:hypothetical protein